MEKTKVIITVEGLGEQTIYVSFEDAVKIYATAGQEIVNRLLASTKTAKVEEVQPVQFKERFLPTEPNEKAVPSLKDCINKAAEKLEVTVPKELELETPTHHFVTGEALDTDTIPAKGIQMPYEGTQAEPAKYIGGETTKPTPMIVDGNEVKEVKIVDHKQAACIIRPFTSDVFTRPKLVMARCPHCGVTTTKKTILGVTEEIDCHFCKKPIEIEKVILTESMCPKCNKFIYFYAANGLSEFQCRDCDSIIDVTYLKDEKRAVSANLIKRGNVNYYYGIRR